MKWSTASKLGRASNLPTVWTNVLAATALSNPTFELLPVVLTAVAVSCFYIAGMFLNDVFDLEWDRQHQPGRPLIQGEATVRETVIISIVLLIAGLLLILPASGGSRMMEILLSVLLLIGLIVLYDWKHKHWPFSPWIMGGCRLMVYLTAAAVAGGWNANVLLAGLCLLVYIAGITYAARAEHRNRLNSYRPLVLLFFPAGFVAYIGFDQPWIGLPAVVIVIWLLAAVRHLLSGPQRKVPQAVGALLAGIALIDAALLFALQQYMAALAAGCAFALCLIAQRKVAAT